MSNNVTLTINGQTVTVPSGVTIWAAARKAHITIPTLCHHPDLKPTAACRICVVEVEGARTLIASCSVPATNGMVVLTNSPKVREARKLIVELLMANHPHDCLTCDRNQNCELQKLTLDLGIKDVRFKGAKPNWPLDDTNPCLVRDQNKCILCGRCVRVCEERQTVSVYTFANRGFNSTVSPAFAKGLGDVKCTYCGQCANICPTAAITIKNDTLKVMEAINDPNKIVIVQTAPAVRVALGELFGYEPGTIVTGKMVAALRRLGFDKVMDTNFTADLTIIEEANEFLDRFTNNWHMPMITSCSPGWINFLELFYPELKEYHSSCKSPQQMFGVMLKTYYAEANNIDPKNIISVSVMPCTAKKFEALRPEMCASGYQDVDYVLTTREIGQLIKSSGIRFRELEDESFDSMMGLGSGAGTIFGNTGGVMEAALRTAYEKVTSKTLEKLEFAEVRGMAGIRETDIQLGDVTIKVAVAHGLGNARQIMESIKAGNPNKWDFIEIMACPGGCISGGGQPINRDDLGTRAKRMAGLYQDDINLKIRKSHENPEIIAIYRDYLGDPGSRKAHKLLHTQLIKQEREVDAN